MPHRVSQRLPSDFVKEYEKNYPVEERIFKSDLAVTLLVIITVARLPGKGMLTDL